MLTHRQKILFLPERKADGGGNGDDQWICHIYPRWLSSKGEERQEETLPAEIVLSSGFR